MLLSALDQTLVKPLAFRDAKRLVVVTPRSPQSAHPWQPMAARQFYAIRQSTRSFEGLAALRDDQVVIRSESSRESVQGCLVTPGGLRTLGLPFAMGRDFQPGEAGVVLPHAVWQRRFGSDPSILGRSLELDGRSVPVLGILAKGVQLPMLAERAEILHPLEFTPGELQSGDIPSCWVMGRLRADATIAAARIELRALGWALAPAGSEREDWTLDATGLRAFHLAQSGSELAALGAMSLFLLLLTCANVAGLGLARMDRRARESALRAALGGARGHLMGGPLAEALLLALAAALVVLCVSSAAAHILNSLMGLTGAGNDLRLAAATLAVALPVALGTGLAPALLASRGDLRELLNQGGGNGCRMRWRKAMVAFQVALATALLTGSGLMVRALWRFQRLDIGIQTRGVLTAQFHAPTCPPTPGDSEGSYRQFFDDVTVRLRALPGVQIAGIADGMPLYNRGDAMRFWTEGQGAGAFQASQQSVSSDYCSAMGIHILRGRPFQDWEHGLCVITEKLARERWPGQDPIGKRLSMVGPVGPWLTVVGVAQDHRHNDITREPVGLVMTSFREAGCGCYAVLLRTRGNPSALAPLLRRAMAELSPETVLDRVEPLQAVANRNLEAQRLFGRILGAFGLLAGLLAALGIHGVAVSQVQQSRREYGLRMALGARPAQVLAHVFHQTLHQAGLGMGLGLLAALALSLTLRAALLGLDPWDLPSLLGAAILICLLALAASLVPALRALRVEPSQALRQEP